MAETNTFRNEDTFSTGDFLEIEVHLIPVRPGDKLPPRYGLPQRDFGNQNERVNAGEQPGSSSVQFE